MTHPPCHVMAEPRHAGDALQCPLRFRFPPRLRPGQWDPWSYFFSQACPPTWLIGNLYVPPISCT
jgi:hypothetical protein